MARATYDFAGWATKNDLRCSDGRTIRKDAFKHNDGQTVPLVWNHQHNDPMNILGYAVLENRPEGVYTYGTFNETPAGGNAKLLVQHGDITGLSIFANHLTQNGGDVLHGTIREVSLVLAGANPGAFIDSVLVHGEDAENEAIIYTGEPISLYHADEEPAKEEKPEKTEEKEETVQEVFDTLTEKQKTVVYALIGQAIEDAKNGDEAEHSDEDLEEEVSHADGEDGETIKDVFDTLTEKQKTVVYALIGQAIEDAKKGAKENNKGDEEPTKQEEITMSHNVFEKEVDSNVDVLSHADMEGIFNDAKRFGSLKEAVRSFSESHDGEIVLRHDDTPTYGIENINYLFPDAHKTSNTPVFYKRKDDWVGKFMGAVHHTPFSRIKSIFADITDAEARAKGYVKGAQKVEEVFSLLTRTTTPTTVYKKQKLDRDDVIDIRDFDVVAWIKGEMRMMLDEEVARAALIGDGRNAGADKINETNIRPIWTDDPFYTINAKMTLAANADDDVVAKTFIKTIIKNRKHYRGSGNPTLFTTEDMLTNCLLLEDLNGRVIYEDEAKLARALRVKEIVTVPVMEGQTRTVTTTGGSETRTLYGIVVNPDDYTVGADKNGEIGMFDDFDINYNAMLYLIETRCSGALTLPYSAMAVEAVTAA